MSVDLSVSIANFNTKEALAQCVSSVLRLTDGLTREVIVVDNGSTDGSVEMLRERFPEVRVIANETNLFFAKAHNQAFAASRGDFFLILNSDIEVRDDIVARMVTHMKTHPGIGALGCHAMASDGSLQKNCSRDYPLGLAFLNFTFLGKVFRRRAQALNADIFYRDWDRQSSRDVDVIPDSLILVRRALLEKMGGPYDEGLTLYFTENDLCLSLRKMGAKTCYLASGHVVHMESLTVKKMSPRLISAIYRRDIYHYYAKHEGRLRAAALLLGIHATRALIFALQALGLRRFKDSLVWGVRNA